MRHEAFVTELQTGKKPPLQQEEKPDRKRIEEESCPASKADAAGKRRVTRLAHEDEKTLREELERLFSTLFGDDMPEE